MVVAIKEGLFFFVVVVLFLICGPQIVDKLLKKSLYSLYDITTVALKKEKKMQSRKLFFLSALYFK